jgi:hypothetical protein
MKMSESIAAIATALSKAQADIDHAAKNSTNPHFKSKYADLATIRAAIREPLAVNDLAIVQGPRKSEGGVEVETMVIHKSGEWISESVFIPITKWDAHGMGSAIKYGRRYGLASLLCIVDGEDDDGNGAIGSGMVALPNTDTNTARMGAAMKIAEKGAEALRVWWGDMTPTDRKLFTSEELKALKAAAIETDKKDS